MIIALSEFLRGIFPSILVMSGTIQQDALKQITDPPIAEYQQSESIRNIADSDRAKFETGESDPIRFAKREDTDTLYKNDFEEVSDPLKNELDRSLSGTETNFRQKAGKLSVRFVLDPKSSPILATEIDGSISSLPVKEGQSFRKGQVLLKLECSIERSIYNAALVEKQSVEKIYFTKAELGKTNSINALEVQNASFEYEKARANLSKELSVLEKCTIRAPFNGIVTVLNVAKSEYLKKGDPAMEIINNSSFLLSMIVPSHWLSWLKPGSAFDAYFEDTNKTYKAKVKKIGVKVDSVSKTVSVKGVLTEKPDKLIYGMSGQAIFKK